MRKKTDDERDLALRVHVDRLGLRDVDAYRSWCAAQGLPGSLYKSATQREREIQIQRRVEADAALKAARRLDRHPEELYAALRRGAVDPGALRRPYLRAVVAAFRHMAVRSVSSQALYDLLLHSHRRASFTGTEPLFARFGNHDEKANTLVHGLVGLALRRHQWQRPLTEWAPRSANPRRQFASLARHLLARYEVPACFDAAWFHPEPLVAARQQGWFHAAGNGTSLRAIDFPFPLTKRMAHLLLTAVPDGYCLEEALRWAQAIGMGATERAARALAATWLGSPAERVRDEPFWASVGLLIADNPLLDPAQIGPLLDWLRWERQTPVRPGDASRLPVGFTMQGRSVTALLRRMESWHAGLARARRAALESWEPCGVKSLAWTERELIWEIHELTTSRELTAEGAAMRHCVGTYVASCAQGQMSVWSVTANQMRVMTVAVQRGRAITEARGRFNVLPEAEPERPGLRLGVVERALLVRSRGAVQRWARESGLTLPAYLS